jgi:hypothetical protein
MDRAATQVLKPPCIAAHGPAHAARPALPWLQVHASRRVFESLKQSGSTIPVVHHIRFSEAAVRDEIVINTGGCMALCCRRLAMHVMAP